MKLVSLMLTKRQPVGDPIILDMVSDLSSFGYFQRSGVQEMLVFSGRTLSKRCELGAKILVVVQDFNVAVCSRADGLTGVAVADKEYPERVLFGLLLKILGEYSTQSGGRWMAATTDNSAPFPLLGEYLAKYQDPRQADPIMRVQETLKETEDIARRTLESLLQRGETLQVLMQKSGDLSRVTKGFADKAADMNSCCVLL